MPKDTRGIELKVGQLVAVAAKTGCIDGLYVEIKTVTRVENGKVYLNDSKRALNFPDRIAVVGTVKKPRKPAGFYGVPGRL